MNTTIIRIYFFSALLLSVFLCSREKPSVMAPEHIFDDPNLKVITSIIKKKEGRIAVIYGNPLAVNTANNALGEHVDGEKFKMVTWKLKPMPNWYGTDMNGQILSIETVDVIKIPGGKMTLGYSYKRINEGRHQGTTLDSKKRAAFIIDMPAAVMP